MIKRILVLWAVFGAYIVWADGRRFTAEWTQLWTEPLMLLLVYALLRAPLRKDWKGDLAAALPLVWLYLIHDEYFARWGDVPSISDIALAKDLWVVAGPVWGALGLCVALIPVIVWLRALDRSRLRRIIWPLLPLSALTLALFVAPTGTYLAITSLTPETEWADRTTAEEWGRMYSVLLRQARRLHMSEEMRGFGPIERTPLHIPAAQLAAIDQRNVHLFVM